VSRLLGFAAVAAFALIVLVYAMGSGWLGSHRGAGEPTRAAIPREVVAERRALQTRTAAAAGRSESKQILFGDLHVHSTFSTDAFLSALPLNGGQGAHPVSEACDFARFCSSLDFWSINDHDVALTPRRWRETIDAIRECNAVSGDPANPDVVAYLGWEWTQMGNTPDNHYGHKNVVLRDLDDASIPTRPITAKVAVSDELREGAAASPLLVGLLPLVYRDGDTLDLIRYLKETTEVAECPEGVPVRELPDDCRETVATPAELYAKLSEWDLPSIVIPHGTTWGFYTPAGSAWDKQIQGAMHDPRRQTLIEIFSGHGNSEEYRSWREVVFDASGAAQCPEPTRDYLPSCWRAGELIRERCLADDESAEECERRAAQARSDYLAGGVEGHLVVPGARPEEWLDSGQCRDCFQPAFNTRPKSSVQYIMALRDFANPAAPRRFEFGFIASSDNHSARPGTGYKEFARRDMTEAGFEGMGIVIGDGAVQAGRERSASSLPVDRKAIAQKFFGARESERQSSFFLTGGLVAVHASGRSRFAIWDAMQRKEVYATSGPRTLLWFDLVGAGPGGVVPMGGSATLSGPPVFVARAVGSLAQQPGCPEFSTSSLSPSSLERLCRGECYNPGDERRRITRIEVVRIRPQDEPGEAVDALIEDPWQVFACAPDPRGCTVSFSDPDFAGAQRDALYYVRAIEERSEAVNAGGLRCERDVRGNCAKVDICEGRGDPGDDCLAETEERAWSSPIFVSYAQP
jgi:hypothetical protein